MKKVLSCIFSVFVICGIVSAQDVVPVRTKTVINIPTMKAPAIDGKISSAEYAGAQPLVNWGSRTKGVVCDTQAFVGRDADNLYLAARCFDAKVAEVVSGNDALWMNDCVEAFIDVEKKKLFFAHLIGDCAGEFKGDFWVPDEWGEPTRGAKAKAQIKTGREKGAWTIEMSVPLKSFGVKITDKSVWSMGFCREKKTDPVENSSFLGWFNRYATWPDMTFDKRSLVVDGVGLKNISAKSINAKVTFKAASPAEDRKPAWKQKSVSLNIAPGKTATLDWAKLMPELGVKTEEGALLAYTVNDGAYTVAEEYLLAQKKEAPKPVDPNKVPEAKFVKSVLDDPNFWPVLVWAQPAGTAEKYQKAGVNVFVGGSASYPTPRDVDFMNAVWDHGMYTMLPADAHRKWAYYLKPGNPTITEGQFKDAAAMLKLLNAPETPEAKALLGLLEEKDFIKAGLDYMNKRKGKVHRNHMRAMADQLGTVVGWKNLTKIPAFAGAMAKAKAKYPKFDSLSKAWRNRRIMEAAFPGIFRDIPMMAADHPSFLGWTFGDEPDNAVAGKVKNTPEEIFADFIKLRNLDNKHPIFLNLGCGVADERFVGRGATDEMYPKYAKACDILCYDVYPCNSIHPNGPDRLHLQGKGVKRLRKWAGPNRKIWTWLEVNSFSKGKTGREPTHDEIFTQHWMAIVHGAQGHGYFCHSWDKKFLKERMGTKRGFSCSAIAPDVLKLLAGINKEIQELAPVLNSKTVAYGTADMKTGRRVDYRIKKKNGATYLFAVNMYREPASAEFTIPGVKNAKAKLLYAKGTVDVKNGKLNDKFKPYEVRRYKIK